MHIFLDIEKAQVVETRPHMENTDPNVSYTPAVWAAAVWDRLIPQQAGDNFFVTSQRPLTSQLIDLFMHCNQPKFIYRHIFWHTQKRIHDTKMPKIDAGTIVFYIFVCWSDWSFGGWCESFCTENKYRSVTIMARAPTQAILKRISTDKIFSGPRKGKKNQKNPKKQRQQQQQKLQPSLC